MQRVLLMEDDDLLAEGLAFAIEKEGFKVDRACSLAEARMRLAAGEQPPYCLLLLDVMLPDGNGFELCREVRAEGSSVPILFLTAHDEEANVVRGLELGGDDYLTKPIRLRELVSRMKAVLRRSGQAMAADAAEGASVRGAGGDGDGVRSDNRTGAGDSTGTAAGIAPADGAADGSRLTGGGLTLRPLDARVTKDGRELELTPVEMRLLALFLKHPGQTLTRAQLLDRLWDEQGEFVDDNTLSVHIRRLREKVEDQPSRPSLILTVRGVGYRFDPEGGAAHG